MGVDLRGRSGEEPVRVCGAFFGVLKCVFFLFFFPPECIFGHVHERSLQAPIWVTSDSKSTHPNQRGVGKAYQNAGRDVSSCRAGFLSKLGQFAPPPAGVAFDICESRPEQLAARCIRREGIKEAGKEGCGARLFDLK